jgi:hypothetical protein
MQSTGKELAKFRAKKLRDEDRAAVLKLREGIKRARKRRSEAMKKAVAKCRRVRLAVRAKIDAYQLEVRARLKAEVAALRGAARNRCQLRRYRIRQAGGGVVAKRRAELAETRRLRAQLQRLEHHAKAKRAKLAPTSKERREESDDHVRGNLPRELVGVFDAVRKNIKGGPRRTRTEAFLEWAEEHPEDVLMHQQHDTDREVARLVAEHEQVAGRLRKGRTHYAELATRKRARGDRVPF